jgi:hypothetical protein
MLALLWLESLVLLCSFLLLPSWLLAPALLRLVLLASCSVPVSGAAISMQASPAQHRACG